MRRPTGDQVSTFAEVGNILSWRLIMKYFLWSFSPFRWFKKSSCLFLAKVHCSAVITRSSGATNTDRVIRGPRYTESFFNLETAVVRVGGFVITAGSSSYYEILHIACMLYYMFLIYLFFFIVETLCMYLAWFPFHSFNPVNNKFLSLNCFVFFYDHSRELTATVLHYG